MCEPSKKNPRLHQFQTTNRFRRWQLIPVPLPTERRGGTHETPLTRSSPTSQEKGENRKKMKETTKNTKNNENVDPNKPTKSVSSFFLFCKDPRKSLAEEHPGSGIIFIDQPTFAEKVRSPPEIANLKFRLLNFQAFADIADTHTRIYLASHIIGHLRLINGDNLHTPTPMPAPPASARRTKDKFFRYTQLEDGETAHIYLWGNTAPAFRVRWNESEQQPSVLLLTTLYPKNTWAVCVVTLTSTASTKLFLDSDIDETRSYMAR